MKRAVKDSSVAYIGEKQAVVAYRGALYPAKVFTRAHILYFLMGTAAAMFAAADVVAQFDQDPNTHTATSYVKQLRGKGLAGLLTVVAALLWLVLHMLWDGFPL